MKKLVIPVAICALALVGAVLLLLLPVEDAMAVHTTIAANINKQDRYITFYISANSTANSDVVIIPAKTGQTLKVAVSSVSLDGSGGILLFEDSESTAVASGGSVVTLTANAGLQIADIKANSEHFVSVVVSEDAE